MIFPDDYIGHVLHGDCLSIMKGMPDKCVDLVLTDPPYGVSLGEKDRAKKMSKHGNDGYLGIRDTREYVRDMVIPAINMCREKATRVVLTPGSACLFEYPSPDALWSLYWPNGAGIGRWKSFTCWQPVLCYGPSPVKEGCFPDTFATTEQADKNGHPCPKPLALWTRILNRIGGDGIVFDPFCGSGTTLVAAKMLGRRYIGIDIEERYVKIAEERLRNTTPPLPFTTEKMEQGALI